MFEDKEVMEIPALNSAGRKAKVDLEDFQYLSQFNWEYLKMQIAELDMPSVGVMEQ